MTSNRSPLKGSPLRNPGQSVDEEIRRLIDDKTTSYFLVVAVIWAIALIEWIGLWRDLPRQPLVFTFLALAATACFAWNVVQTKKHIRKLRLGRDGELLVGQFLDGLRVQGARVFHDVPAESFNLDHVVVSPHGVYVVETKTITKPRPDAQVVFDGQRVTVAGRSPERDPIRQVTAEAAWLRQLLEESTGRKFPVRGVVVYPGWWVERMHRERAADVWVLEPKALPSFIEHEPELMTMEEVAMAAFHLSRYIRSRSTTS